MFTTDQKTNSGVATPKSPVDPGYWEYRASEELKELAGDIDDFVAANGLAFPVEKLLTAQQSHLERSVEANADSTGFLIASRQVIDDVFAIGEAVLLLVKLGERTQQLRAYALQQEIQELKQGNESGS